jgi:hypothetical protein
MSGAHRPDQSEVDRRKVVSAATAFANGNTITCPEAEKPNQSGLWFLAPVFYAAYPLGKSQLQDTCVRRHDLPAVCKLLYVHRAVSHHRLL